MLEVFKIVHEYYDDSAAVKLCFNIFSTSRGNEYKLQKHANHYYLRKLCFCLRVVDIWNSLSESVVDAYKINTFSNSSRQTLE